MNDRTFDTVSRRASLLTLGGAGLAALSPGLLASAKAKRKKKQCKDRCKNQPPQCERAFLSNCTQTPEICAAQAKCCSEFSDCGFVDFFVCATKALNPTSPS